MGIAVWDSHSPIQRNAPQRGAPGPWFGAPPLAVIILFPVTGSLFRRVGVRHRGVVEARNRTQRSIVIVIT